MCSLVVKIRLFVNVARCGKRGHTFVSRNVRKHTSPPLMCALRKFRSACAFAQSDQNLHSVHFGYPMMQSFPCGQWSFWSDCAVRRLIQIFDGHTRQKVRLLTSRLMYKCSVQNKRHKTWLNCTIPRDSCLATYEISEYYRLYRARVRSHILNQT